MKNRNIIVTLEKAREWYNSNNAALKELALRAFNEKELKGHAYTKIKTFSDALAALGYSERDKQRIQMYFDYVYTFSEASAAMLQLNIIRKALNKDCDMHLTKNVSDQHYAWYPYFRFITESCTYYSSELKKGTLEKIGKITSKGVTYDVIGGNAFTGGAPGLGGFQSNYGVGYAYADIGFLGCATKDIAKHFGKYFGMLVMKAMYGNLQDIQIN